MRHRKVSTKLGRKSEHRQSLIANQVCSLILHQRIRTTLAKAKAVRPWADRMVTLGKEGTLHARRMAIAFLRQPDVAKKLFEEIAPRCADRKGGYTRIVKLGARYSDAAPMAYLEWVDAAVIEEDDVISAEPSDKKSKGKSSKKAASKDEGENPVEASEDDSKKKKAAKKTSAKKGDASAESSEQSDAAGKSKKTSSKKK
ncbi:MAG: 50S ribosomal protein L17 [Verrucomicrobiales bacterium]